LAGAHARARGVKRGDGTVLILREAVIHVACVDVISRDRPPWVDVGRERALAGACARAGNIDWEREGAVRSTHEPVSHVAGVDVTSQYRPRWVDAVGVGALEGTRARVR